uniref:Aminopeptidase N n=1 Tax=Heligmosomoides polygyrus TaxID=6339 RepID=A0A183F9P6_HELPZ
LIGDLSSFTPSSFDLREIVFVAQMPHVRERIQLEYSPWFQFLLGLLQVEVEYSDVFHYVDGALLELEVRMGYRTNADAADDWHNLIATNITRTLECTISDEKVKMIVLSEFNFNSLNEHLIKTSLFKAH